MRPKADPNSLSNQASMVDAPLPALSDFINLRHPLVVMADNMNWRKRLGEEGMEWLLSTVLSSAVQAKAVKRGSLAHVCVDSTVMEKNIAYRWRCF